MKSLLWSALLLCTLAPRLHADEITLKIATLAPEGSSWMKLSHQLQKAIETRTEGRVKIKFYAGGVQGDERDVLRKIRLGQISGAAITGIGLAAINPEVRALEIARTYEELDHLREVLNETLRKKFEEKGFIQLGWGDVGPVHLFSSTPVRSLEELRQTKLWLWSDDPVTRQLFTALDIRGVPLGVPDVLPGLSTGAINALFGSPLAALALQWSSHVKYMSSMVVGQATGSTVIATKVFEKIAPTDRQIIIDEARRIEAQVIRQVRADNTRAIESMRAQGMQVIEAPAAFEREMHERGDAVAVQVGKNFSKEFQDQVKRVLDEYRKKEKP